MAITYIVGIPRSGKTYYAMYQLWKFFVHKPKDTKLTRFVSKFIPPKILHNYDLAYTNINQFDFTKTEKIKKLDLDELKIGLMQLHQMYMDKKTDDELLEVARELKLDNTLIVIDEVHNFLGTKVDEMLKWWLTYHGHLHQDLFFITQDLSLVSTQYKSNAEFFYKAIPPSARLSTKKFRYTQYRNSRMAMNGQIADFTLPAIQEIFNMYVSGAKNNAKSIVHKFLKIVVFFMFLLVIAVYIFLNSFENEDTKPNEIDERTIQTSLPIKQNDNRGKQIAIRDDNKEDISNSNVSNKKRLFEINCISNLCTYKKVDFPKPLLTKIIADIEPEFYYFFNNSTHKKYFLLVNEDTFNFLDFEDEKNAKHKKNKKTTSSTFSLL